MTLEEVEETLVRLQSKPGVLGTLIVTGSLFTFSVTLDKSVLQLLRPCCTFLPDQLPSLQILNNIILTVEGKILKTSLAPKMLEQV